MNNGVKEPWRKWLLLNPAPSARLRLFCFPFAGGGASSYSAWSKDLPGDVDVCPIQLPGRESRRQEPAFDKLRPLVEALSADLRPLMSLPFAFLGHSMGALISFELARELRRCGAPTPLHMFASAHRAPQLPDPDPPMHGLPEDEFLERMAELNGTHKEVLSNIELMRLFIPLLRCDAALCETYAYVEEPPLKIGISVYGGLADPKVTRQELEGWRELTESSFELRMFPGDHFYMNQEKRLLLSLVGERLRGLMAQARG